VTTEWKIQSFHGEWMDDSGPYDDETKALEELHRLRSRYPRLRYRLLIRAVTSWQPDYEEGGE